MRFYRDCYQTDLKGVRIRNFESNQCEKRFIPSDNALFHENYLGFPIDTEWAKEVEKILFLDSKEKALYGGTVFISGTQSTIGRKNRAFVPMYIHEFSLDNRDQVYFLSLKETYLNPDFFELANNIDPSLGLSYEAVSQMAPPNTFGFDNYTFLDQFFEQNFKSWNFGSISNYLIKDFDYHNYHQNHSRNLTDSKEIMSGLMFGIFKRPTGSLGILTELNQISEREVDSQLMRQLFQLESTTPADIVKRNIFLPATLSSNQESAIYSSDAYPITQIIGPPGTGKSYTISALAIDAISNNKSVLIVSRNPQACKVIVNIIEKQFGLKGSSIKAYNQVYKKSLISKISKSTTLNKRPIINPSKLKIQIVNIINDIESIEEQIVEVGQSEYEWGNFYSENQKGFFSIFKDKWYQYRKRTTEPIWRLNEKLKALRTQKERLVRKYVKAKVKFDLASIVSERHHDFSKLNDALKEGNLTQHNAKINKVDFDLVLNAIPLWTTTSREISKCLPLVQGLFDLVIFDEASQCDLASSIPAIYRAKELIVVGDPHQLRHLSFLSAKKQNELKKKNSVTNKVANYRSESLIDWTNIILSNPQQTTYLDEHFRSKTDIIQFSNDKFYNNQLKLIRSTPLPSTSNALEIKYLDGTRNAQGVNQREIQSIIDKIKSTIEFNIESNEIQTIGIASPFSEQVKNLKKAISEAIPLDLLKKHQILIGTPFHFQGEERDIMLISLCVDKTSHIGAINYLNRGDVFNVLITRARNKQIVFSSIETSELPSNSLLKEYLDSSTAQNSIQSGNESYDAFSRQVKDFLIDSGFDIFKEATYVSGVLIDLVIINENKCVCIDLIGYPGDYEAQFSLEDLRILNRIQTPVFFLPYSSWYLEQDESKVKLINFVKTATI